ncbi:hypothetical protein D0T50_13565, partial [Bacteroides sp. 214]|nr:hypothetical protein [Bacteroides sp. 214]
PSLSASFNYQWNSMANNFKLSKYKWDPYLNSPLVKYTLDGYSLKNFFVKPRQLHPAIEHSNGCTISIAGKIQLNCPTM